MSGWGNNNHLLQHVDVSPLPLAYTGLVAEPECIHSNGRIISQWKLSNMLWDSIDYTLHAGVHTHPEVVHSLADPAVVLRDFLLKVLIEAGPHRGELGQRWPIVLFNCRTEKIIFWLTSWALVWCLCCCAHNSLPPVFGALPALLFCNSFSFCSSSAAFLSSSSCCLIRLAWPAAATACRWWGRFTLNTEI